MTKEELIDKYREINVDHSYWYESVYDWFIEECASRGVEVRTRTSQVSNGKWNQKPAIQWSGFWSQGDGAAFAGRIDDMNKALGIYIHDYPILDKYVNELRGWYAYTWDMGRGNNILCGHFEREDIAAYLEDDHPFAEIWEEKLGWEIQDVVPMLSDLAQELCDLLYKALEDEYNHLTSDEVVWDTIVANELDTEMEDER